jgi:hypothetical protein
MAYIAFGVPLAKQRAVVREGRAIEPARIGLDLNPDE